MWIMAFIIIYSSINAQWIEGRLYIRIVTLEKEQSDKVAIIN